MSLARPKKRQSGPELPRRTADRVKARKRREALLELAANVGDVQRPERQVQTLSPKEPRAEAQNVSEVGTSFFQAYRTCKSGIDTKENGSSEIHSRGTQ